MGEERTADVCGHSAGAGQGVTASGGGRLGRYQLAPDGTIVAVDDELCRLTGYCRDELVDEHVSTLFGADGSERYESALGTLRQRADLGQIAIALSLPTADGERVPCGIRVQALDADAGPWASIGRLRPCRAGEQDTETTGAETDRAGGHGSRAVRSLADRIRDLGQTANTIGTRTDLAERVCQELAGFPEFGAVWVGRTHCSEPTFEPEATAGVDDLSLRTDGSGPIGRAVETGAVQIGDVAADGVPRALAETGTTVTAVPLVHEETVYGLLVVTAGDASTVGPPQRRAFAALGATLGHAICCHRARRTLLTSRVTEVTLWVGTGESFLSALSARLDCRVVVEGVVVVPAGRPRHYVTVHCASSDRIRAVAADWQGVEAFEVVSEHDDACVIEVEPPEPTLHWVTAEYGGSVRELVYEAGDATVTVEVPAADDTRELLAALRAKFDTVQLAAQRDANRPVETSRQFRAALLDRLSDRQQTALRLAYRAGYFEWPRESTGEDIAATMDVSAPTFHKHLRHAESKLAAAVVAPEEGC